MGKNYKTTRRQAFWFGFWISFIVVFTITFCFHTVPTLHAKKCPGKGKCTWCWCPNYNGSDHLHDFNF